jgi:mannose-6-phosphate isomerase
VNISKLYPEYKDYIWGGEKLKIRYNKETEKTPCAESWEFSFHKDGLTRLADGRTLLESVTEKELGENFRKFPFFPLLIKFIDARESLSVQVHPSDEYALKNENSFGKTEMWYIVEAEEGAGIYLGFKHSVTKEEYEQAIIDGRLTELLNFYQVKAGECYFIPSGTIHAIGAGCLICEVQQNSNVTYRVYDYDRKDKNGNKRELHVKRAVEVTNLNKFQLEKFENCLGRCLYFTAEKQVVEGATELFTDEKTFHCVTCVLGCGFIDDREVKQGDSFFVPANHGKYTLKGDLVAIITKI